VIARFGPTFVAFLAAALVAGCASPGPSPAERTSGNTMGPQDAQATGQHDPLQDGLRLRHVADEAVLHGVAVGRPRVVALPGGGFLLLMHEDVPNGGRLFGSDDGTVWTPLSARQLPPVPRLSDIAATSTAVVVIGEDLPPDAGVSEPNIHAFRSGDGLAWEPVSGLAALRVVIAGTLAGGESGFAAIGGAPDTIAVAGPEGGGWTTSRMPAGGEPSVWGITAADPGFIAWGTANRTTTAWRVDGSHWESIHLPTDAVEPIDIAWAGTRGVVSGWDPKTANDPDAIPKPAAMETTDGGHTWAAVPTDLTGIDTLVTVGAPGAIYLFEYPNGGGAHAIGTVGDIGWQEVTVEPPGIAGDSAYIASIAVSGRRVVAAGNTVGTGAGGDRVVIWTGQLP
jgi:hypothetical protein